MDKEQIVYKLKCALEVNKLPDFEKECTENITQIETYIKKVCKNNYMEFLQSLSSVGELKKGIADIRTSVALVSKHLTDGVESEYFQKAQMSQELKKSYFEQCLQIRDYEHGRALIARARKISDLLDRELLTLAYQEIKLLRDDLANSAPSAIPSPKLDTLYDWLAKRLLEFEERTLTLLSAKKRSLIRSLEELEIEAGSQILDESRRYLSFLGRQFMLDSDQDNREVGTGATTIFARGNAAQAYQSMKRSQVFDLSRKQSTLQRGASNSPGLQASRIGGALRQSKMMFANLQPRFQERESLANLAFSQVMLKKQDSKRPQLGQQQSMMFGQSIRGMTNIMTLDNVLQNNQISSIDVQVDIDFGALEGLRRLSEQLGQEREFISFVESERAERILKLAKLSKRMKLSESLERIVGFFIVQLQLSYNLPQLINGESVRNQVDSALLQLQKALEHQINEGQDFGQILEVKKEMVVFSVALRDQLGLIQELGTLLNGLIKVQDVYSDKMVMALDQKVCEIMDAEDYKLLQAQSTEDMYRYVDKFDFDISPHLASLNPDAPAQFGAFNTTQLSFPLLLPYSPSVIHLSELLTTYLDSCLDFWQYLLADKGDFALAYASCDRLMLRLGQLLSAYFFHGQTSLTILQRAQFCTNVQYLMKAMQNSHRRRIYEGVNQGAYNLTDAQGYGFQGEQVLQQLRAKGEESIATELRQKLNDFLTIVEGLQWRPKKFNNTHHADYIDDMLAYLRSTVSCLPVDLQRPSYTIAFSHIGSKLSELLAQSKSIQSINQQGLINLSLDLSELSTACLSSHLDPDVCLGECTQLCDLLLHSDVKEVLDDEVYRKKYSRINLRKLVLVLEKYKNDKVEGVGAKVAGNSGLDERLKRVVVVHKSDALAVAKKLRESINFKS
ncbi:hypothetical protein FGO68_gene683 [Halteria grandinella]|uniref:Exocyst complex subunit EXOC6/Sec15 C-terminal domain-containing protein n=1 Tax=Halteria grandinella TaxID=5974 RepID=A0A8J8SXF8_HALGN|nr:hypothetical protein FGO68_gene683 [Halteria grandinella]